MPKSKKKVEKLTPAEQKARDEYQAKNAAHLEKIAYDRAIEKLLKKLKGYPASTVDGLIYKLDYDSSDQQGFSW